MLSQRVRLAVVGSLGTVAAFFMFGGFSALRGSGSEVQPESAIPKNAFLVATANLAELRRSPIHDVLFADKGDSSLLDRRAFGVTKLAEACGFEPLGRIESLAVAVPEDGEKGDLGVAAKVNVTREELEKCTTALAAERGTKVEPKSLNGFAVVRAANSGAQVGYGHGLLVAGKGMWFEEMLATADGKAPSAREAEAHVAIRKYLTTLEGFGTPTVLVSAVLPRALRDRIRSEMAAEVGARDAAQNAMAGVLGVSAVGVAMRAGAAGGSINLAAELVCDSEDACSGVEKLVAKKRFEWSKELMIRMVGLGPLLDSIVIKRDGTRLLVTASAPADTLAATIDRVLRLRGRQSERPPPAPLFQPPKADEQIPAKP